MSRSYRVLLVALGGSGSGGISGLMGLVGSSIASSESPIQKETCKVTNEKIDDELQICRRFLNFCSHEARRKASLFEKLVACA